jgi:hypothetical protein
VETAQNPNGVLGVIKVDLKSLFVSIEPTLQWRRCSDFFCLSITTTDNNPTIKGMTPNNENSGIVV